MGNRWQIANFSDWPLWIKILVVLVVAMVSVGYVAGKIAQRLEKNALFEELKAHSEKTFSILSASTLESVISEDIAVLQTIVEESVQLDPYIHALVINNEDDEVLVAWKKSAGEGEENIVNFSKYIEFDDELFGSIHIDWSTDQIDEAVQRRVRRVWFSTSLPLLTLTIIIILFLHFVTIRPIKKIRNRIRSLSNGDFETALSATGARELKLLAQTVNRLVESLRIQKRQQEELERTRQELFESKELAEVTLHSIGDAVITTDIGGMVLYMNPVAERLTGWRLDEAIDQSLNKVFHTIYENTRERVESPVETCLAECEAIAFSEQIRLISRDGSEYAIEISVAPIRSRSGEILGVVLVFHDVTHARQMAEKISYQATYDSLTNLINRHTFEARLRVLLEQTRDTNGEHVLLYLDLDQFKVVNDTCGHIAGDALLGQVSSLMQQMIRAGDILGRLGGDEFALLLGHCPLKRGIEIAERLRQAIQEFRFIWGEKMFGIGVSIGIVPITAQSANISHVLSAADQACYVAKDKGRNQVHVYRPDDEELAKRTGEMQWVSRIQHALENNDFILYAQPIVRTGVSEDNRLRYEVMVRMKDREENLVLPGSFIPAAEKYGLMPAIDRWVIHTYFDWLRENPVHFSKLQLCSINLSGDFLSNKDSLEYVIEQFSKNRISPKKICFEITETAAVAHLPTALEYMTKLTEMGCRFSLDDFGTGMASFGYLRNLPVDFIKIDGTFVKDILNDPIDLAVVKSINNLCHVMGKLTIAEFVENEGIFRKITDIGVDYAQGYGIGRPSPLMRTSNVIAMHERTAI